MDFFVFKLLIILLVIFASIFYVFIVRHKNSEKRLALEKNAVNASKQIMDNVETNNTYPKLLDIFTHLDDSIEQHEMTLNNNFGVDS